MERTGIRPLADGEVDLATRLVDETVAGRHQARLGEVVDVLALPGFGAWADDRLIVLATWSGGRPRAELAGGHRAPAGCRRRRRPARSGDGRCP